MDSLRYRHQRSLLQQWSVVSQDKIHIPMKSKQDTRPVLLRWSLKRSSPNLALCPYTLSLNHVMQPTSSSIASSTERWQTMCNISCSQFCQTTHLETSFQKISSKFRTRHVHTRLNSCIHPSRGEVVSSNKISNIPLSIIDRTFRCISWHIYVIPLLRSSQRQSQIILHNAKKSHPRSHSIDRLPLSQQCQLLRLRRGLKRTSQVFLPPIVIERTFPPQTSRQLINAVCQRHVKFCKLFLRLWTNQ